MFTTSGTRRKGLPQPVPSTCRKYWPAGRFSEKEASSTLAEFELAIHEMAEILGRDSCREARAVSGGAGLGGGDLGRGQAPVLAVPDARDRQVDAHPRRHADPEQREAARLPGIERDAASVHHVEGLGDGRREQERVGVVDRDGEREPFVAAAFAQPDFVGDLAVPLVQVLRECIGHVLPLFKVVSGVVQRTKPLIIRRSNT